MTDQLDEPGHPHHRYTNYPSHNDAPSLDASCSDTCTVHFPSRSRFRSQGIQREQIGRSNPAAPHSHRHDQSLPFQCMFQCIFQCMFQCMFQCTHGARSCVLVLRDLCPPSLSTASNRQRTYSIQGSNRGLCPILPCGGTPQKKSAATMISSASLSLHFRRLRSRSGGSESDLSKIEREALSDVSVEGHKAPSPNTGVLALP